MKNRFTHGRQLVWRAISSKKNYKTQVYTRALYQKYKSITGKKDVFALHTKIPKGLVTAFLMTITRKHYLQFHKQLVVFGECFFDSKGRFIIQVVCRTKEVICKPVENVATVVVEQFNAIPTGTCNIHAVAENQIFHEENLKIAC